MGKVLDSDYDDFWIARHHFLRIMDLADIARHTEGGRKIYRLSLAMAQDKIRDMANALKVLEQKAADDRGPAS